MLALAPALEVWSENRVYASVLALILPLQGQGRGSPSEELLELEGFRVLSGGQALRHLSRLARVGLEI